MELQCRDISTVWQWAASSRQLQLFTVCTNCTYKYLARSVSRLDNAREMFGVCRCSTFPLSASMV